MCVCVCLVEAQETNTKAECLRCSIRENMSGIAGHFFFFYPLATPSPGASQSILTSLFALALLEVGRDVQNRKDRRVKARPTHPHSHVSVINFHVV